MMKTEKGGKKDGMKRIRWRWARHKLNRVKSLTEDKTKTWCFYPQMRTDRRGKQEQEGGEGDACKVQGHGQIKNLSSTVSHRSTHTHPPTHTHKLSESANTHAKTHATQVYFSECLFLCHRPDYLWPRHEIRASIHHLSFPAPSSLSPNSVSLTWR